MSKRARVTSRLAVVPLRRSAPPAAGLTSGYPDCAT